MYMCLLYLQVQAKKPSYEVGVSSKLSFASGLSKKNGKSMAWGVCILYTQDEWGHRYSYHNTSYCVPCAITEPIQW